MKMMQSIKDLSIQRKITLLGFLAIASFVLMLFLIVIPRVENTLMEQKKSLLQNIVSGALSTVAEIHQKQLNQELTLAQAQTLARGLIERFRYGEDGKDYIWINDFHPTMIMHPFVPKLNGTDLNTYQDRKGKKLFVEMANVCKAHGQGFVEYMWQWKDDATKIVPKLSFVKVFQPWGWILGTGLYIEDVREEIFQIKLMITAFIIGLSLILFFVIFRLAHQIAASIKNTVSAMDQLADGDLQIKLASDRNDETGQMQKKMEIMVEKISSLIGSIVLSAHHFVTASREIKAGSFQLSQEATQQAASIEEISSSVTQLNAQAKSILEMISSANHNSSNIYENAQKGRDQLSSLTQAIQEISSFSGSIVKILKTIDEIAFQTNLLALNAAVEAARAGRYGKGFAVVASEINNLSKRSADAAKESAEIIEESLQKVEHGKKIAEETKLTFLRIVDEIELSTKSLVEISVANEEQTKGIDQINMGMSQIDKGTLHIASLSEENASASEDLKQHADSLIEQVSVFKLREQGSKVIPL